MTMRCHNTHPASATHPCRGAAARSALPATRVLARSTCGAPATAVRLTARAPPAAAAVAAAGAAAAALPPAAAPQYSADVAADEWSRRPVPVVARLLEIAAAFGSWWVSSSLHRDPQRAAADMRKVLVDLGPAFVKIGQALSARPDVLPPEYIAELELLQDRIPPFSNDQALQVIEQELGLPWTEVFSSLSPCPVAAASLGQVYRGRLVSNGAEVAVKVQRPGVVEAIGRDTYILRNLAAVARKQAKLNTDLPALVDEWASSLFKELDYRREAANAIRFAQVFAFMPEVVVPQMHLEFTTSRVLVMQWIEGERLRSASQVVAAAAAAATAGGGSSSRGGSGQGPLQQQQASSSSSGNTQKVADDLRLVEIGVRCSLEQMLEEGYFHADPHPGNLLKTTDNRLAYIDFGMMGTIEPPVRQALIRATLHLVNKEYERLADDFVALGLLPRGSDMDQVIPALTGVFQAALAGGVSNISFSTLSADLGRTMYRYSFRLPPYYTLLVRSLSVLEGIALASDPNYKVLGAAYPWVSRRLLLTTNAPELTATLDNLLYDSQGRFNFDRLESLLEQAAKARVEARAAAAPLPPPAAAAAAAGAGAANSWGTGGAGLTTSSSGSSSSSQQGPYVQGSWGSGAAAVAVAGRGTPLQQQEQQQEQQQGLLASVAAAVGSALAGPEGSQLLLSSLQLVSDSNGGGWQQQVSGRGSTAAAAGGPLALVLSPEGRHIRGILEDELAKGLDAAWRLNLEQTLDAASEQLEGLIARAAQNPLSSSLMPAWLQQQAQQARSSSSSGGNGLSSSGGNGISSSSGVSSSNGVSSSGSSSRNSRVGGSPDLIESLLNLPRLAGEDDRMQVEGLQRLAVQLAAFSGPASTTNTSTSSLSSSSSLGSHHHQQQQQQPPLTAQQEANAAALQQVRQAAEVLRWLTSEVQLLSPAARQEALAIPLRILSKLGSRVAARAVRAVLTPRAAAAASPGGVAAAAAAAAGAARPAGVRNQGQQQAGSGVPEQAANAAAAAAGGSVLAAGQSATGLASSSSNGSNGSSSSSRVGNPNGPSQQPAVVASSQSSNSQASPAAAAAGALPRNGASSNGVQRPASSSSNSNWASGSSDGSSNGGDGSSSSSTSTSSGARSPSASARGEPRGGRMIDLPLPRDTE